MALGSFGIIFFFGKHLKDLVDLATTVSFLIAPVIAIAEVKSILKTSGDQYIGPNAKHSHAHSHAIHHDHHENHDHSDNHDELSYATTLSNIGSAKIIDDLKVIEGIGPKIASALNAVGIYSFEQLSNVTPEFILEVLEKAEGNFKLAVPTTWPQQAKLASLGKWDQLKQLQDQLFHLYNMAHLRTE